jgi:RNA polymerase subunit RPABC4/transcription elongation factor Spt4
VFCTACKGYVHQECLTHKKKKEVCPMCHGTAFAPNE